MSNPLSRRRFLQATGAVAFGFAAAPFVAQSKVTITNKDLGGGLTLFQGAGCNVVATRSDDGILMIDGGLKANADALLGAVRKATGKSRLHTMINTHWHPDHTGCNEAFGRDGGVIFAHEKTKMYLSNRVTSATFEGRLDPLPEIARPNRTARLDGSLEFGGRKIDYGYMPAAHTDGDLFLHFPDRNVLVAGGVVSGERWPIVDYRAGAWFGGRVRALERLAKVVAPTTQVVPAHGRLITGRDIVRLRDIYDELFKTMIGYMNMGLGAEDVVQRNPLKKYEAEFADAATFLDGAYRSMQIAYVPD
jgi:glyoxylase-like metal-dependent hydrolase (beta-lactamase superfamily II)